VEDRIVILVISMGGRTFRLVGSFMVRDAKCKEFLWSGRNGESDCWMVPQDRLLDLPEKK